MREFRKLYCLVQSNVFRYGLELSLCSFLSLFFYSYPPHLLVFVYLCPICLPNTHDLVASRYCYKGSLIAMSAKDRQETHVYASCIKLFIKSNKLPLVI